MADAAAPEGMPTDDDVFAAFDADFDSIVAGEPVAPESEAAPEPEPEPEPAEAAPETAEDPEPEHPEETAEAAAEPEPSAPDEEDVPEPTERDPQWYQRSMGKVRRQRKAAREEAAALRAEIEALKQQRAAAPQPAPSQPQQTKALTKEALFTSVAQEMGLDPDTATDFEIRTAQMLAETRFQAHQNEQRYAALHQADMRRQVQLLEKQVAERVAENPFVTREELLHAESRGIDMDEYIADRRGAFESYLTSQGYVRADQQQQTKAPPKPMPVPANKGKTRKQTAAPNTTPTAPKSYDSDEDYWSDFDAELDKHFTS